MPDAPRSRDGPDDSDDDDDAHDTFDPLSRDTPDGVVRNEDDEGWRFELVDDADAAPERPPLEPGSPSAENVFFVLVGVALTLLLLLSAFVPLPLVA